jgi:predicted amidophosphoribosyltransferase
MASRTLFDIPVIDRLKILMKKTICEYCGSHIDLLENRCDKCGAYKNKKDGSKWE